MGRLLKGRAGRLEKWRSSSCCQGHPKAHAHCSVCSFAPAQELVEVAADAEATEASGNHRESLFVRGLCPTPRLILLRVRSSQSTVYIVAFVQGSAALPEQLGSTRCCAQQSTPNFFPSLGIMARSSWKVLHVAATYDFVKEVAWNNGILLEAPGKLQPCEALKANRQDDWTWEPPQAPSS